MQNWFVIQLLCLPQNKVNRWASAYFLDMGGKNSSVIDLLTQELTNISPVYFRCQYILQDVRPLPHGVQVSGV